MRKIIIVIVSFLLITGCSLGNMDNTPTKKVEEYLGNYQTLHSNVIESIDTIVDKEITFTDTQKDDYRDIIKKHYQNLTYTVKEETVNGDKATVEVEVEVTDYSKVLDETEAYKVTNANDFMLEDGTFDDEKFNNYKLEKLNDANERVKYTIYFSLTQDTDEEWSLDALTDSEEEKLLGIYKY